MAVGLGMVGQLTVVSEGGSTPITHIWLLTSVSTPHMATETVGTRKATANTKKKKKKKHILRSDNLVRSKIGTKSVNHFH